MARTHIRLVRRLATHDRAESLTKFVGGPQNYEVSEMAYYNDITQSQNGQSPSDTASVGGCGYQHWEGQTVSGTFSSGTTFTVNLDSDAQYYSVGQCEYHRFQCADRSLTPSPDAGVSNLSLDPFLFLTLFVDYLPVRLEQLRYWLRLLS